MVTRHRTILTVIVAALVGAAIWVASPWATGHLEPWDAPGRYFVVALVVGGLCSGLLSPRPIWAHYAGAVLGQAAYMLGFLPSGPLVGVGVIMLLGYSLLFLGGALAGALIRMPFAASSRKPR